MRGPAWLVFSLVLVACRTEPGLLRIDVEADGALPVLEGVEVQVGGRDEVFARQLPAHVGLYLSAGTYDVKVWGIARESRVADAPAVRVTIEAGEKVAIAVGLRAIAGEDGGVAGDGATDGALVADAGVEHATDGGLGGDAGQGIDAEQDARPPADAGQDVPQQPVDAGQDVDRPADLRQDSPVDRGGDAHVPSDASPDASRDASSDGSPVPLTLFVSETGNDMTGDGSAARPWRTIGHALAVHGDVMSIVALPGTYKECVVFNLDQDGVSLAAAPGGGAVIDGQGCGHVVWFKNGLVSQATTLRGFEITNGHSSGAKGGGVLIEQCSPLIEQNDIHDNFAYMGGGGIYVVGSSSRPVIRENTIRTNSSQYNGAGIFADGSKAVIERNVIAENDSFAGDGGGILCRQCTATIRHNVIRGNRIGWGSIGTGGGVSVDEGAPTIASNLIVGNIATAFYSGGNDGGLGGGIYAGAFTGGASPIIVNNTVAGNMADFGGGIALDSGSKNVVVRRNVIAGNRYGGSQAGGEGLYSGAATVTATIDYNDFWNNAGGRFGGIITGLTQGTANLNADPLFVACGVEGYCLAQVAAGQSATGPCVDAGDITAAEAGLAAASTRSDGLADTGNVDLGYHR